MAGNCRRPRPRPRPRPDGGQSRAWSGRGGGDGVDSSPLNINVNNINNIDNPCLSTTTSLEDGGSMKDGGSVKSMNDGGGHEGWAMGGGCGAGCARATRCVRAEEEVVGAPAAPNKQQHFIYFFGRRPWNCSAEGPDAEQPVLTVLGNRAHWRGGGADLRTGLGQARAARPLQVFSLLGQLSGGAPCGKPCAPCGKPSTRARRRMKGGFVREYRFGSDIIGPVASGRARAGEGSLPKGLLGGVASGTWRVAGGGETMAGPRDLCRGAAPEDPKLAVARCSANVTGSRGAQRGGGRAGKRRER